jgi:hypothetical protein
LPAQARQYFICEAEVAGVTVAPGRSFSRTHNAPRRGRMFQGHVMHDPHADIINCGAANFGGPTRSNG